MGALRKALASPRFTYPFIATLILLFLGGLYYLPVRHQNEALLVDNAFRVLASIAEHIQNRLAVYRSIIEQTEKIKAADRSGYLSEQVDDLKYVRCPDDTSSRQFPGGVTLVRDDNPEASDLLFRFIEHVPAAEIRSGRAMQNTARHDAEHDTGVCASVPAARLVYPLGPGMQIFDEVILADQDGAILFNTIRSGERLVNTGALLQQSGQHSAAEPQRESAAAAVKRSDSQAADAIPQDGRTQSAFRDESAVSGVWPVRLGGLDYYAFLTPVPVNIKRPDISPLDSGRSRLVLIGLITKGNYAKRITTVPGTYVITVVLLILVIACGSWPVLRFTKMRATETIRRRTVIWYGLLSIAAMASLVLLLLHASYVWADTETKPRLTQLSEVIELNFDSEIQRALKVLSDVARSDSFKRVQVKRVGAGETCSSNTSGYTPDSKAWTGDVLKQPLYLTEYPYFDHLFWADQDGNQEIKWSTHHLPTPSTNLCDYAFFKDAMNQQFWGFEDQSGPQFRVDAIQSPNTGKYVAVVTTTIKDQQQPSLIFASVVTPLMSLVDPVLPPEYGFAVVDPSGRVLFHSQSQYNGEQNLLDMTGNAQLAALISTRDSGYVDVYYLGATHRMYVRPIKSILRCPWTLVTFRDLTRRQSEHVQRMTLAAFLVIVYLFAAAIVAHLVPLPRYPSRWLWPSRARIGRYHHLVLVLACIALSYYHLIFLIRGHTESLLATFLIPLAALAAIILHLQARDSWIMPGALLSWTILLCFFLAGDGSAQDQRELLWESLICISVLTLCLRPLTALLTGRLLRAPGNTAFPSGRITRYLSIAGRQVCTTVSMVSRLSNLTTSYSLVALGAVAICGALASLACFHLAYNYTEDAFAGRALMAAASAVEDRACRVATEYNSVAFSANPELEPTARWLFLRRRLEQEVLDRYDTVFLGLGPGAILGRQPRPSADLQQTGELFESPDGVTAALNYIEGKLPAWYVPQESHFTAYPDCLSATWTPTRDLTATNRLRIRVGMPRNSKPAISGSKPAFEGTQSTIFHQFFPRDPLHISQDLQANLEYLARPSGSVEVILSLGLGALSFFALRATVRRLFITDFSARPWPDLNVTASMPLDRNLILVGLPFTGKTQIFSTRTDTHVIDLAAVLRGETAVPQKIDEPVVVLDHFAFAMDNAAANNEKLEILESLVYGGNKVVIILTTIDPLFYLEGEGSLQKTPILNALTASDEMVRWTKALIGFETLRIDAQPVVRPGPGYYKVLWSTCSVTERVILYQLATEGWSNCKNKAALAHLFRRGLIGKEPEFRIRDDRFGDFVANSVGEEDRKNWEAQDGTSAWDGLKVALFVCAGLAFAGFLLVNGYQAVGSILGGMSALGPVVKEVADARSKGKAAVQNA